MSVQGIDGDAAETVGNPALWQVKDFVEENAPAPVNPVKAVTRIYRGQWGKLAGLALLLGLGFAFIAYTVVKPVFESQGLVRVVAKEPKILYADNDDSRLRLYDAFVSAEATYIQSQQVLSRAHEILIEKLDDQGYVGPRPRLRDVIDALEVKKLKGLIAVSGKSTDGTRAQQLVNALLASYAELHERQSDSRQILRARELEVRVQELMAKQYTLNKELLEVGEEYDASSLAKAHLTKVTQLEELDIRVGELTNTLVEMETTDGALDADTGDMEIKRATLLDRAMADMVFERAKRAAELEKLKLRYMSEHPKVANLTASLQVIDDAIESRRRLIATLGKTGAITGADGAAKSQSLAELNALKRKLIARRNELSINAKDLNSKLIQLKRINAEQFQIAGMLAETRRILDQVRLESRNSLPGTIEVLSRGNMPDSAASDKRAQFAMVGFMAGCFFAAVLLFARRQLSSSIIYSDDVEIAPSHAGVDLAVLSPAPTCSDMAIFLSQLQFSGHWRRDRTNVISIVRFDPETHVPLTPLAEVAIHQGLKTLVVCAADDGANENSGFIESICYGEEIRISTESSFDYISFGSRGRAEGYSIDAARNWLQKHAQQYDLVLIYTGVVEQHYSTRVLPSLSDLTIASISPGNEKRLVRRFTSQCQNLVPLFFGARKDDPNLAQTETKSTSPKGFDDAKAA
ncbi:GumC domain-containing protein [Kordiimonas aquimaris]|uniref:hypothetical protein n=1 Tax=Kordiimonas aquimaris TaxID=707591 RepID=UPI0021D39DDE|nr:hypothetical protein [Kordiimonas aquimaris]